MAKYAVISDIHGNYEALELVLKDAEKNNVDKIICLGDLVNKNFQPEKVVDSIRANASIVVKGNHDASVVSNPNFKWVRSKLGTDRLDYLDNLPIRDQLTINKVLVNLFHATPDNFTRMFNPTFESQIEYAGSEEKDPNKMFVGTNPQVSIAGHTHVSYAGLVKDRKFEIAADSGIMLPNQDTESMDHYQIGVTDTDRAIINVGSVGDNNKLYIDQNGATKSLIQPYISYAIIDEDSKPGKIFVTMRSIPYKNTLMNIYVDRVVGRENGIYPTVMSDETKMKNSLVDMGISEETIDEEVKKGRVK